MDKKLVLELNNHKVYYVKTDVVNYFITVPINYEDTNICIELKSKMDNYNLELNDEIWVMENVKNTFSYIDDYNITLVLPVLDNTDISILEKIDTGNYDSIDKQLGYVINSAYISLKEEKKQINNQVIIVNNDRYKTFINWFVTRYKNRVICKTLLELIQLFNANATSYKKLETPAMTFVVGSYNTEVDAPKTEKKEDILLPQSKRELVTQTSSGFTSYWLLAIVTLVVAGVIAILAFLF